MGRKQIKRAGAGEKGNESARKPLGEGPSHRPPLRRDFLISALSFSPFLQKRSLEERVELLKLHWYMTHSGPRKDCGRQRTKLIQCSGVSRWSTEPSQPRSQGFSVLNWVGPNSKGKSPGNEVGNQVSTHTDQ